MLSRPIGRSFPDHSQRLVEHLQPEVERLREMTGKPFSGWRDFT